MVTTKYKLHIAYDLGELDINTAKTVARALLLEVKKHEGMIPEVSLLRDGDRSGANMLAPIAGSLAHYKNGKIPISEAIEEWDDITRKLVIGEPDDAH